MATTNSLCQGVGVMTPGLLAALVAGRKPIALPEGFERGAAYETFVTRAEALFEGPCLDITPDLERRHCTLGEFVAAHDAGGGSRSHGFDGRNRRARTAFYVHDTPAVRCIVLDTACPAGSADLCMDDAQFLWLEERLMEVHSSFRAHDGRPVRTEAEDRVAVVISHHGSEAPTSSRRHRHGSTPEADGRLLSTLLRFDNVVLWLNGHTHGHAIRPRPDPRGQGEGLWEVTTGSLVDWPCQARMIELFDAGEGVVGIASTMIDHDSPLDPGRAGNPAEMAALHRQLAANVSWAGFGAGASGSALDRNAIMLRTIGFAPA